MKVRTGWGTRPLTSSATVRKILTLSVLVVALTVSDHIPALQVLVDRGRDTVVHTWSALQGYIPDPLVMPLDHTVSGALSHYTDSNWLSDSIVGMIPLVITGSAMRSIVQRKEQGLTVLILANALMAAFLLHQLGLFSLPFIVSGLRTGWQEQSDAEWAATRMRPRRRWFSRC
ncbi:hypothetical protein [Deinococcus planocerae]|uniref:hypothetical protein n=1 Tax=Deinococcus planocerae TaxID=1737569 RepID=UPI000C7F06F8|nr:hypothetical protein [Deinococcus planocerae]